MMARHGSTQRCVGSMGHDAAAEGERSGAICWILEAWVTAVLRKVTADSSEIHLDPGSAPLLPVGPVGVDPVATAELPSAVPLAKQALPPGVPLEILDDLAVEFSLGGSPLEAFSLTLPGGLPLTLEALENRQVINSHLYYGQVVRWNGMKRWGLIRAEAAGLPPFVQAKLMQQAAASRSHEDVEPHPHPEELLYDSGVPPKKNRMKQFQDRESHVQYLCPLAHGEMVQRNSSPPADRWIDGLRLIQISEIVTSDQRGRLSRMVQADEFDEVSGDHGYVSFRTGQPGGGESLRK
ncbi:unnamed protein product [Cladocopium goreaui]|uniref:Uncharacterized protein n=1 Tax=Cladocopium goreaui TaxID=2562237 RepID=A0A9P1D3Y5_9DINO|nr:unnamed protein product [Cladocopium goreaui]